jgi:hypothetical protein
MNLSIAQLKLPSRPIVNESATRQDVAPYQHVKTEDDQWDFDNKEIANRQMIAGIARRVEDGQASIVLRAEC